MAIALRDDEITFDQAPRVVLKMSIYEKNISMGMVIENPCEKSGEALSRCLAEVVEEMNKHNNIRPTAKAKLTQNNMTNYLKNYRQSLERTNSVNGSLIRN